MTAPTSDRAQRARKTLGNGLHELLNKRESPMNVAFYIDALITERLGGGEREYATAETDARIDGWNKVCNALANAYPQMHDELQHIKVHARPAHAIRTLAQTVKDATARAEAAEAANMELDKERRSSDQSVRDLRAENARLRAQIDAMTGEQVPVAYDVKGWGIFRNSDPDVLERERWKARQVIAGPFEPKPLYEHPSPAARVVEWDRIAHFAPDGKYIGTVAKDDQGSVFSLFRKCPERAVFRRMYVGEVVGPALTPNADGQTARVDEVSDTANGLRHVARGPNSPQGAVAYGRTAKDATQLLDTIRQHKSTPNADGAK